MSMARVWRRGFWFCTYFSGSWGGEGGGDVVLVGGRLIRARDGSIKSGVARAGGRKWLSSQRTSISGPSKVSRGGGGRQVVQVP